ncbi:MAG: VTT domain-containing protein [Dehalococcoidia bacterium]|nr:VTT domain-containing protein [Dehalococcoidia bacterium]
MVYCVIVSQVPFIARLRDELLARRSLQVALFIAILGGGFGLLVLARNQRETADFLRHGYLGVFVINMLTCASILFPIPGEAINVAAGSLLNPLTVTVVATTGATIGEMTAYVAGVYGRQILLERYAERYAHAERWMNRYGVFAVFLFALVPMLVFDLIGIVAGCTRYSIVKFAAATFTGRFLRCLLLSYTGYALFDVARFF